jgi:dienelactone hydrolase
MKIRSAVLALAVLCPAVLGLSACSDRNDPGGEDGGLQTGVFSLFDPVAASPTVPFPFDGFFSGTTDPTLNIPNGTGAPFVTQANLQDGFSTTASVFTDLLGTLDYSTLAQGLMVIDTSTLRVLTPGVDYTTQASPALATNPLSGQNEPISDFRSRVLIEPLHPFSPSTRYVVVLTRALKSEDGLTAAPSELFRVVRSATPVAEQDVPVLQAMSPTQKATLEALRAGLIRPIVSQLAALGLAEDDIVLTWSFTTQSIGNTLSKLAAGASAGPMAARNTGATLAAFNSALPPIADVYFGTLTLPYYLAAANGDIHSTDPLTQFWLADATKPDLTKTFLGQAPCGAYVTAGTGLSPSVSTTVCFPEPVKRSDVTVPVLVTLPNANSGRAMPENGWPVVIFQHGITGNRSQALALAPALSLAGFAVVSIDLPLHGLPPDSPLRIAGVDERTFDLDLVNNTTGAAGPDGVTDSSGTHFINLSSLITSRDNLRQAVSDLLVLDRSLGGAVLVSAEGQPNGMKFDGDSVRFVGHSLGGIVGGTLLGVDDQIGAATLAMPGGGIAKLLDASVSFGPRIAAGLAASGVVEGTDNYETFLRFAQTLVDSGDPINYAVAAAERHPLHMIEVVGSDESPADQVVPNNAPANAGTVANDRVTITGFLSGTDPLVQQMGLSAHVYDGTPNVLLGPAARGNVVQFTEGDHGSILSPAASAAATMEMQKETASFLASNGLCLPIGGSCP